jgi:ABC-type lipoprotein export system ATPase subunit
VFIARLILKTCILILGDEPAGSLNNEIKMKVKIFRRDLRKSRKSASCHS